MTFHDQWNDFYSRVTDVAQTLKLYPIAGSEEEVRLGMPLHEAITQPAGMFSAPSLFGLADISGTWLAMHNVPQGVFPLAVASSINVVSNTRDSDVYSVSRIVRAGRTVIVTDTEIFSQENDTLIAKMSCTYSVPRPKKDA
ncbi:PaaI family thioesterase [Corynebacterium rouxii]|uniref:PaaI family thioesterase n=1 Tax=Corynebacterium rouxii TaxID=2719119 RepID=A0ABU3PQV0_9CORY|nr:PaaI family thioesterase [Corynebacterium rouxii]MDT9409597.1 PaaI family thioesterase [Corynebacterium rouxii]MDT9411830.1 PaaI family thioesterase [Corynebacterium rouxii]